MDLNHLHLGAADVSSSRAFYERYFGFRHDADHGDGVFLRNDDGFMIAIDPVSDVPVLPSWFHYGFCLAEGSAVRALHARMTAEGVDLASKLMDFGDDCVVFYCNDPDGYRIEVSFHAN